MRMRQLFFSLLIMKIATWNVNSIRSRLNHFEKWAHDCAPDIILLQELKCIEEAFPLENLEHLGYNSAIYGQKSYNGVAILSKYPLEDVRRSFTCDPDPSQARYLEAFTGGVRVASVYVPNGQEIGSEKFQYKMRFFKSLQSHLDSLNRFEEAIVIGGDFNVAPYPTDIHTPSLSGTNRILCSIPEQQALRSLYLSGFHDAFSALNKTEAFTWWDYRQGSFQSNKGYRIDHLLLSSLALDALQNGGVDTDVRAWVTPSDHAPVWIDINFKS